MSGAEHRDTEHRLTDRSAPAVSIITPTYNHAAYIEACIASVQAQGRPDWEMLVIDDGSTDGTAGLAESMAAADPRIRLFRQKNRGILRLHETYNFALAQAKGRYVAVLEGDDLWLPNKLAVQLAGLEADPEAVLAWSDAVFFGDASGDIGHALPASIERRDDRFRNEPVGRVLDQLYLHNCIAAVTVVIKTEVL
ncbi:MAG: glycosyltransferase family A protein, partial [Bacteroidota bacterium]